MDKLVNNNSNFMNLNKRINRYCQYQIKIPDAPGIFYLNKLKYNHKIVDIRYKMW